MRFCTKKGRFFLRLFSNLKENARIYESCSMAELSKKTGIILIQTLVPCQAFEGNFFTGSKNFFSSRKKEKALLILYRTTHCRRLLFHCFRSII